MTGIGLILEPSALAFSWARACDAALALGSRASPVQVTVRRRGDSVGRLVGRRATGSLAGVVGLDALTGLCL